MRSAGPSFESLPVLFRFFRAPFFTGSFPFPLLDDYREEEVEDEESHGKEHLDGEEVRPVPGVFRCPPQHPGGEIVLHRGEADKHDCRDDEGEQHERFDQRSYARCGLPGYIPHVVFLPPVTMRVPRIPGD